MKMQVVVAQLGRRGIIAISGLLLLTLASGCKDGPAAEEKDRHSPAKSVLSNGGFETGDLSEEANNVLGNMPWLSANSGGNAITVCRDKVKAGSHSLKWNPIGWNTKDDGTEEDASTFILTDVSGHVAAGATSVRVSGAMNTVALATEHRVNVILANDSFSHVSFDTILDGNREGWQLFSTSMPLAADDRSLFLAFKVLGTASSGAPNSTLYLDDLSLVFVGADEKTTARETTRTEQRVELPRPPSVTSRPFRMGFTPFPWDVSEKAVRATYEGITQNSDIICHHMGDGVPWPEALADVSFPDHVMDDWKTRKDSTPAGMPIFLALTPLNEQRNGLALYHGEKGNMPLPKAFEGKKLDDPDVIHAYAIYCQRAVDYFNPEYVAVGIEVNNLIDESAKDWPALATLHKSTYQTLKKTRPNLPVFATVTLHELFKENESSASPQQAGVKELLPYMDMVGLSFYSFINTVGDPTHPAATFEWASTFFGDKRLAIAETGYPAEPTPLGYLNVSLPGTPQGQVDYTSVLLEAAQRDEYVFVIEFLYRDYDALWDRIKDRVPEWAMGWRDCGMLDGQGRPRPALDVWQHYLTLEYSSDVTVIP